MRSYSNKQSRSHQSRKRNHFSYHKLRCRSPENSGVLLNEVSEIVEYDIKREGRFLGMLLGILGTSMLQNIMMRVGKSPVAAGRGNNMDHVDKKFKFCYIL